MYVSMSLSVSLSLSCVSTHQPSLPWSVYPKPKQSRFTIQEGGEELNLLRGPESGVGNRRDRYERRRHQSRSGTRDTISED